jgi:hypothetical protein
VEVGDLKAKVARLRQQGVTVADPGTTPARALFMRMTDLDGVQIEVMEFGPECRSARRWTPGSRAGVLSRLSRTRI